MSISPLNVWLGAFKGVLSLSVAEVAAEPTTAAPSELAQFESLARRYDVVVNLDEHLSFAGLGITQYSYQTQTVRYCTTDTRSY